MPDVRHDDPGTTPQADANRRSFFRRLAAVGGGGLAGLAAGSAAAAQGTRKSPPRRMAPTLRPRRLKTVGALRLSTPLQIHRVTNPPTEEPAEAATPGGPRREPSSRERLMGAVSGMPGGRALLQSLGVPEGSAEGDPPPSSAALRSVQRYRNPLAEAYALGVTLTPTHCERDGEPYRAGGPLNYLSLRGTVTPYRLRQGECWVGGRHPELRDTESLLYIRLRTPGRADQPLAYLVELSLHSERENYMDFIACAMNDEPLSFRRTSDGTWLALVELPGSGDSSHCLTLRPRPREGIWFQFLWLNVVAV